LRWQATASLLSFLFDRRFSPAEPVTTSAISA
jgi:hypothetical protein